MNDDRLNQIDGDELALDEAMVRAAFDTTAARASEPQLAALAALAARQGEVDRAPTGEPAHRARPWGRLLALAAAVALMAAGGWYANELAAGPGGAVTAQATPAVPAAAAEASQAVAGWDDAASQQVDEVGTVAMIDDDPLAAWDGWDDADDPLATGVAGQ